MRRLLIPFILLLFIQQDVLAFADPNVKDYFISRDVQVNVYNDRFEDRNIRYIETYRNEKADTLIFFVHGANSQAMKFKKIMSDDKLLGFARMVALDRPGYAQSSPGIPMVSIEEQSKVVGQILDKFEFKTCILVGHSYGAAIVANYAAQHPDQDLKLLLISAAIDPDREIIFPTSKWVKNEMIRNWFPARTQVAAYENLARKEELEKMRNIWPTLDIPVYHLHGLMDMVITYENVYFSQENIKPDNLKVELIEDMGHFIIRFRKEKVIDSILEIASMHT
jgi:pimeloyl-ACP methyl ester carboxylesterase